MAVDVLLIVDNSGSMCEEQALLIDSFFDEDCPIDDLVDVPAEFQNADDTTLDTLSDDCGFMQLMAAAGIDARVGVLSTDVGACDDRFNFADDPAFADASNRCCRSGGRFAQRGGLRYFGGGLSGSAPRSAESHC